MNDKCTSSMVSRFKRANLRERLGAGQCICKGWSLPVVIIILFSKFFPGILAIILAWCQIIFFKNICPTFNLERLWEINFLLINVKSNFTHPVTCSLLDQKTPGSILSGLTLGIIKRFSHDTFFCSKISATAAGSTTAGCYFSRLFVPWGK